MCSILWVEVCTITSTGQELTRRQTVAPTSGPASRALQSVTVRRINGSSALASKVLPLKLTRREVQVPFGPAPQPWPPGPAPPVSLDQVRHLLARVYGETPDGGDRTAFCGIVIEARGLPFPNIIPFPITMYDSEDLIGLIFPCPICGQLFREMDHVRIHFVFCVRDFGNSDGVWWDLAVRGVVPVDTPISLLSNQRTFIRQ